MSSNQLGRATDDQWLDFVAFTACEKSRFSLKRRSVFQTGAKIYVSKKIYILGSGALQRFGSLYMVWSHSWLINPTLLLDENVETS